MNIQFYIGEREESLIEEGREFQSFIVEGKKEWWREEDLHEISERLPFLLERRE